MSDVIGGVTVIGVGISGSIPASLAGFYWDTWVGLSLQMRSNSPSSGNTYSPLVQTNIPPSDPKWYVAFQVALDFSEYLNSIGSDISELEGSFSVLTGGINISGSDIKTTWRAITGWTVTGTQYPSGYAGLNHGNNVEIGWQHLAGYGAQTGASGTDGWNYLALHELAHNTLAGLASRDYYWTKHQAANGTAATYIQGNAFFEAHEASINSIARDIGSAIGKPIIPLPRYGFGY